MWRLLLELWVTMRWRERVLTEGSGAVCVRVRAHVISLCVTCLLISCVSAQTVVGLNTNAFFIVRSLQVRLQLSGCSRFSPTDAVKRIFSTKKKKSCHQTLRNRKWKMIRGQKPLTGRAPSSGTLNCIQFHQLTWWCRWVAFLSDDDEKVWMGNYVELEQFCNKNNLNPWG